MFQRNGATLRQPSAGRKPYLSSGDLFGDFDGVVADRAEGACQLFCSMISHPELPPE